jgi:tripartite-type tricarboxylate transporter receptor subunit TctC
MVRILNQPQLRERWAGEGTVIAPSGAEELGALVKTERARWADVIKRAGVKPE